MTARPAAALRGIKVALVLIVGTILYPVGAMGQELPQAEATPTATTTTATRKSTPSPTPSAKDTQAGRATDKPATEADSPDPGAKNAVSGAAAPGNMSQEGEGPSSNLQAEKSTSDAKATTDDPEPSLSDLIRTNLLLVLAVVVFAIAAVTIGIMLYNKSTEKRGKSPGKQSTDGGQRKEQSLDLSEEHVEESEVVSLRNRVAELEGENADLKRRLKAARQGGDTSEAGRHGGAATGVTPLGGGRGGNDAESWRGGTSAAGAFRDSPGIVDLVRRFNAASGRRDYETLRNEYRAQSYSNDRKSDLSKIFADATDRFWLIPNPANPGEAVLIPGFASESRWSSMRDRTTDHALAHHFELQQGGDRLTIIRPATLRRGPGNEWELQDKGAVSGLR